MVEDIKVPHKLSKEFISQVATGALLSGPSSDGLFHLVFFRDAVSVEYETAKPTLDEGKYTVHLEPDSINSFREDQSRISMPALALKSLADIISQHLKKTENAEAGNRG